MNKSCKCHCSMSQYFCINFQVWHDFTIFLLVYLTISLIYRGVLIAYDFKEQRQTFELLCIYADRFSSGIPLSFLTGFYVTQVVNRWWEQFMALPWPDQLAFKLLAFVPGNVSCFITTSCWNSGGSERSRMHCKMH